MYKNFQDLMNKKVEELEKRINELNEELSIIENDNNIFDKLNKRKQKLKELFIEKIKNDIGNLEKQIEEIKNKDFSDSDEISDIINMGIDLDSSDIEYLKIKEYDNNKKHIEKIEDLVLVHKTDFAPINGVMYSAKDTGAKAHAKFALNKKEYNYEYLVGNDTLHFCLNGPVTDHFDGDWNDKKYSILIPFNKVNRDNLLHFSPEDTYFQNKVILPAGSIIICPISDKEIISKQNPNVEIITYNNSISLSQAIECVILYKGYKIKGIDTHGWFNDYNYNVLDLTDKNNLRNIINDNNIVNKEGTHYYSENLKYARLESLCNRTIAIINCLIDNSLEEIDVEKFYSIIKHSSGLFGEPSFKKKDFLLYLSNLTAKIKNEKMEITENDFIEIINNITKYIEEIKHSWGLPIEEGQTIDCWYDHLDYINSSIGLQLLEYSKNKKNGIISNIEKIEEEQNNNMHI